MTPADDPIALHLGALARTTLAAAPPPPSPVFLRIVATRRRAQRHARRLQLLLALASAAPVAFLGVAWLLRPATSHLAVVAGALTLLAFALALVAVAGSGATARSSPVATRP